ncbi:MAG: ABC transporter ATP-binding protein [Kiritimatiellia bacterium]
MSARPLSQTLRPFRDYVRLPWLALSILLTLLASGLTLWLPRMLGGIVDGLVEGALSPQDLLKQSGLYLGVALLAAFFSKWMRQLPMRWGPLLGHRIRTRMQRHLLNLDENQIHDQRVGELMSRLQSDVNAVADMMALGGHSLIRAFFTLGIAFTMMFQRSTTLALMVGLLLPLLMLIGFLMIHSIRFRHLSVQEQLGVISSYCQESFGGLRILRGLGLGAQRLRAFGEMNDEYIIRNLALSRVEIFAWPLIQSGFILGNVLLLWLGGMQVIRGEIRIGLLVEFQQYLMILQWPALSISWTLSLILRGRASLTRLQEVMDAEPQIDETAELPDLRPGDPGKIRFENVSLSLEGSQVLKNINLETRPGQFLGITGPTGSGKTLLMQLLLRRQDPQQGRILIDGVPLAEIPPEYLYELFRIAPQEPVLFSMTLRENLLLACPEAGEALLQRALHLSALDQDLAQLPEGLETRIGERGVTLSGGQRQRCAIARALLSDPPVLLLDDSLSAVDSHTETTILERLLPELRSRGLWMVSHRFAALRHCDHVLVLRDGQIVEAGAPGELLSRGGEFAELAARQRLQASLEDTDA